MSKSFYDTIPLSCIVQYQECADSLTLANNCTINVSGTALVRICPTYFARFNNVMVYILHEASHPIILGTEC